MIDTSKAQWELSKEEKAAIKWLNENGYEGELVKQYLSKTKFILHKDGVEDAFELPQGMKNMNTRKYMEQYKVSFEMKKELIELRAKVKL